MVKKKRQSDPSENGDDSTESCEENVKSACPHVAKAVDLLRLKKFLKIGAFVTECLECKKCNIVEASDPDYEIDLTLWMCLRCGTQLCGRARNKHALNHFHIPHSDSHALTANTTTWEIFCYICNNEVTASSSKKLHECIEYLKKQCASGANIKSSSPIELPPPLEAIIQTDNFVAKEKDMSLSLNLPRVRGLTNLGNTCFFNSVMQCLVQTPYLLDILQEMSSPGERFTLPGGMLKMKGSDADDCKELDLPPIAGELSEWGPLTRILAETLAELQAGDGCVYSPRKLLSALVNKLPQFGGGDQHDAHELLRHLLEAVRSEDLRRYQSVILNNLGMSSKVDPSKVDGEVKQKVKFYGQQASDTMLRPEQVFRGFLVSTLECQDCMHQSDRAEYFLDLSLPVAACRPQPPAVARRKTPQEENNYNSQEESKPPSKHQIKKERNAAKRSARKNKGGSSKSDDNSQGDANGSKEEGKSSSEQSDADVEDNLEDAPQRSDTHSASVGTQAIAHTAANFAAYHMESGYNSEKVISSDSIRTSPVDLDKEKTDVAPDRTDKVEFADISTSTTVIPLEYKPLTTLENASNPDSGVASPEATKHNSTETVDAKEPGSERPASRISFAPEYSNEVVSRGISVQGSRTLMEHEAPGERRRRRPAEDAFTDRLDRLRLDSDRSPRYVCEEDECSVQSCLGQFTALELLTGNNKVGCDACTKRRNGSDGRTVYTNATKRFLVSSPPAVLILHLKRFQIGPRCLFRKMSKHVDFPIVLDLAPFCAMDKLKKLPNVTRGQSELLYSLYGVVEHSGGMHGGHYVAYVKVRARPRPGDPRWWFLPQGAHSEAEHAAEPDSDTSLSGYESGESPPAPAPRVPKGKWYYVSDSMVQEVAQEKVLRAQAYLLFYERIL